MVMLMKPFLVSISDAVRNKDFGQWRKPFDFRIFCSEVTVAASLVKV